MKRYAIILILAAALGLAPSVRLWLASSAGLLPQGILSSHPELSGPKEPGLRAEDWPSVMEQIAAERRAFHPGADGGLHAYNSRGGERLVLHADGTAEVRLRGEKSAASSGDAGGALSHDAALGADDGRPDAALKLKAAALGREGQDGGAGASLTPEGAVRTAGRHRTEQPFRTAGGTSVVEWWKSEERGFEAGWNISARPPGEGRLRLELALESPWPATAGTTAGGDILTFEDPAGSGWRFVCDGLLAEDAAGRRLEARMEVAGAGGRLVVSVDDAGAVYPVVIDPWLYADRITQLKAPDSQTNRRFGTRIAACGDVVAVGASKPGGIGFFEGEVYITSGASASYPVRRKVADVLTISSGGDFGYIPFAVSGDTVAVGPMAAPGGSTRTTVYERNAGGPQNFGQVAEFDTGAGSYYSLPRLSGDFMAIPQPESESGGLAKAGIVRIHRRDAGGPSGWAQVAELDAGDLRVESGRFGFYLQMDGRTLTIFSENGSGVMQGLIFHREDNAGTKWTRLKVLAIPGLPDKPLTTVLGGDTLAVAVPGQALEGIRIFERNAGGPENWGLSRTIPPPPGTVRFGYSLSLLGGLLAAGSPGEAVDHDNNNGTPALVEAGVLRIYGRDLGGVNMWGPADRFSAAAQAETGGRYGEGAAFAGGRLFIGLPKEDTISPVVTDAGVVAGLAMTSGGWSPRVLTGHTQNATGWGTAVSVSGEYVAVGAPRFDGPAGVDAGWVFLFRDGVLVKSVLPSAQQAGEQFGASVSLQGGRLAAGSPLRSGFIGGFSYDDLGAVTVFERNEGGADNWGVVKSFSQASVANTSASPKFGSCVSLDGDLLAVGAPNETALSVPGASVRGRVKIHARNAGGEDNWGQVKSFQGLDSGTEEMFGTSVCLSGDTLLAGAPWEETDGLIRCGAAYLHRRNEGGPDNWGRAARLVQPDPKGDSWFGHAVALDGDTALIGAPHEDRFAEPNVGAAYFFEGGRGLQNTWVFTRRWQPDDLVTEDQGGAAVALSAGLAVIGIPANAGATSGKVELLSRHAGGADAWGPIWSRGGQESFGLAVGIDGQRFAVGEPLAETVVNGVTHNDRGSVVCYSMEGGEFGPVTVRQAPGGGAAGVGRSVVLHGDWLVLGAAEEDIASDVDAGAAYIFHRDRAGAGTWGFTQRISDVIDNAGSTRFGAALAMDDQWLAVGVPGAHRAQLYRRQHEVTPQNLVWMDVVSVSAGGQPNALGSSLALSGGVLLAGAPLQDVAGQADSGAVYLFERNMAGGDAWGLKTPLTATDPGAGDHFGASLAASGSLVAVGAPLDNHGSGADAGSVYLFERNQGGVDDWGMLVKVTHGSQQAGDRMGADVALSAGYLLAGLPGADAGGFSDAGRALLFARNEGGAGAWGMVKSFVAENSSVQAGFGTAVAVDADHAVIGAPFADPRGLANAGAVYVYGREWKGDEAWNQIQTLAPTQCTAGAEFGAALALDRNTLAAGAPGDHASGRGHVFSFRGRQFYDDWAMTHGLEGAWALPGADADGDGQPNLIEMVLGSHPRNGGELGRITLNQSGGQLILTAWKNEPCAAEALLGAEVSTDLQSWTAIGPAGVLVDTAAQFQVQVPTGPAGRTFVRWRASLP